MDFMRQKGIAQIEGKFYRTAVRPVILYGEECCVG